MCHVFENCIHKKRQVEIFSWFDIENLNYILKRYRKFPKVIEILSVETKSKQSASISLNNHKRLTLLWTILSIESISTSLPVSPFSPCSPCLPSAPRSPFGPYKDKQYMKQYVIDHIVFKRQGNATLQHFLFFLNLELLRQFRC